MTLKETIRKWEPGPPHLIVLFGLLQVFVGLLTNGFTLSFDEAMWHYIGRNWFRHGLIPYSGGIDNKSPLIFAVFGLSDKLFGLNYWFPRLLGTLLQSIGLYYVYKIAKHISGDQAGKLAILFYGLSLLWHSTGGRFVSYTETYDVFFIIIAFYLYITAQNNRSIFMSGFMAGIGLGFRLTAFFGIITIFIASLHKSKTITLMFCAGVLTGIFFLALIGFIAGIDLHNVFTYALTDNFGHGSATDHPLSWRIENFSDKFFYSGVVLFYPVVLVYFFIKRKVDLFALWLIFEFVGINMVGIYDTAHFKELLPSLTLISAFAVAWLINFYKLKIKYVALMIGIIFFPNLSESLINAKKILSGVPDNIQAYCRKPFIKLDEGYCKRLGGWVRSNTTEGEMVLVAGYGAQVQAYSERLSPTVYFNVTQTPAAKKRFFQDFKLNKPVMILIPLFSEYQDHVDQDMRQFIDKLVAKDYYLDRCMYNYNIYRIRK
ncbi:MAG TPA: glycosyltransferase family 39 protein [Mucilaginibacter sp.]|jgi:hypothetical protein|nr:glycosyltransferase family 39 protein [Mucilaginibacter sp.]